MSLFHYRALDKGGKEIHGRIEAGTESVVIERLRNLGYYPTEVSMAKGSGPGNVIIEDLPLIRNVYRLITQGKVKSKNLALFTRQLATLISAGLPLLRSLRILCDQVTSTNLKKLIRDVGDAVENGSTFSEALAHHPHVFNKLYVNMVKAGEIGGALDQVLDRLAQFAEKSQALRAKVTSALYYPITVVVLATVIVAIVLVFVIPRFQELWDQADARLPGLTQSLVAVSDVVRHNALLVITVFAALAVFYHQINRTERGHYLMDALKLRIPLLGNLVQKSALARFSRTFATLLDTGVPILQSLIIVKDTAGNEVLSKAVLDIHSNIREGGSISEAMLNHPVFPPLLVHMISVGEETGAVDEMLGKVADTYEREVDSIVNGLTSLLEPLLIVLLGVVIGMIVVALYLPIFRVTDLFNRM